MDTDSFYLALSGNSLDDIVKASVKKEYLSLIKQTGSQLTSLAKEHQDCLSQSLLVQEVFG